MRKILVGLFLFSGLFLSAQEMRKEKSISIGYLGNYLFQPGVQLGVSFDVKNWQNEGDRNADASDKLRSLFVRPQVAYFSKVGINQNVALLADVGYRRVKSETRKYIAWSLGLGYLMQSQLAAKRVNLGDGSKEKIRENIDHFLALANFEFGKSINEKISWYSKYSLGFKITTEQEKAAILFLGLGLAYKI